MSHGLSYYSGSNRLFLAWILWASAMMCNALVGVLLQIHVNERSNKPEGPLFDIGFEILPYVSSFSLGFAVPDLCSLGSATLIGISLAAKFQPFLASIILRRVLFISAIAYAGRAITVPMTLLPNPDPDCIPTLNSDSLLLSVILVPFGGTITCADVFYSGHTIPISCALFVWLDYMRYSRMRLVGILVSSLSLIGIVATHFHYTVDVFYGFLITWIVWRAYHFGLGCPSVFYHFPLFYWWEHTDACDPSRTIPPKISGVVNQDLSKDPRLVWTYSKGMKPRDTERTSKLTKAQLALLVVVGMTLSPSWIAVYHKSLK